MSDTDITTHPVPPSTDRTGLDEVGREKRPTLPAAQAAKLILAGVLGLLLGACVSLSESPGTPFVEPTQLYLVENMLDRSDVPAAWHYKGIVVTMILTPKAAPI